MTHTTRPAEAVSVAAALAVTGGFLDAYTYIVRGGVFANAQTGNLVLLGIRLADGQWLGALFCAAPILAFCAGILLTEFLRHTLSGRMVARWEHAVLVLEGVLLAICAFVPVTVPHLVVNTAVSFVCSVQVHTFRAVAGAPYASTMCTGNLRSALECLYGGVSRKDSAAKKRAYLYFFIIALFALGAGMGAVVSRRLGPPAVLFACALLVLAGLLLARADRATRASSEPSS